MGFSGNFISQRHNGRNGPEGELPDLVAIPDAASQTILLAYQNAQYKFFSTDPFVKGAYVTIASIARDGSTVFAEMSDYVERISGLGLMSAGGQISLAYRPVNPVDWSTSDIYLRSLSQAGWSVPSRIGKTPSEPQNILSTYKGGSPP